MGKSRRTRFEIIYEILLCASQINGISKTGLVYKTNSTFQRTENLVGFLAKHGLIEKLELNGSKRYKVTHSGSTVMSMLQVTFDALRKERDVLETIFEPVPKY